jgi:hypothetical protein
MRLERLIELASRIPRHRKVPPSANPRFYSRVFIIASLPRGALKKVAATLGNSINALSVPCDVILH